VTLECVIDGKQCWISSTTRFVSTTLTLLTDWENFLECAQPITLVSSKTPKMEES
jgi:hypothetical protein